MSDDSGVRFLLDDDKKAASFVYKPPNVGNFNNPQAQNATLGVKFAQRTVILDRWYLLGGTKWSRSIYRMKHPIVYSKRGLRNIYRRIKRFFFGDPPMILCREWKNKKDLLKQYPEVNNGNSNGLKTGKCTNQKQKNSSQQNKRMPR